MPPPPGSDVRLLLLMGSTSRIEVRRQVQDFIVLHLAFAI